MSNKRLEREKLDPRVKRTRNLIFRAFSELLAEKGFQAVTVRDIAERAEINRATFYAHFTDKYDLFQYTIRRAFREELEKRTLSACHYSEENLRALLATVCDFVASSRNHCKNAGNAPFDALVESQVRAQVQELLQAWLASNATPTEEQTIAAVATTWALYGLAQHWAQSKKRPPLEAYIERILPLVTLLLQHAEDLQAP